MNADSLLVLVSALFSLSLGMLGVVFILKARRSSSLEYVLGQFDDPVAGSAGTVTIKRLKPAGPWVTLLRRAGVTPSGRMNALTMAFLFVSGVVGYAFYDLPGIFAGLATAIVVFGAAVFIAFRRHQRQMQDELPIFLDRMVRSIKTGSSVVNAFGDCAMETGGKLGPAVQTARRYVELGYGLGDALTELARVHQMKEFQIMALASKVTSRYGGSPVGLFKNLIEMIRHRDRIRRQLYAMTSETRVSALVLAVMPLLIGAYIASANPDYIMTMWEHDSGRWVMIGAVLWQAIGILWLWRLVRSLG